MKAVLYSDCYGVRIDLGNTGVRWPDASHPGYPFLASWPNGRTAWQEAELRAMEMGATEILIDRTSNSHHHKHKGERSCDMQ